MEREKFTPAYWHALEEARAHHARSKTYSGRLLRPHAAAIAEILRRRLCLSVLDYGCGKGGQYTWVSHDSKCGVPEGYTLEQFWGVMVRKFDPAWPPFEAFPEAPADLVICSHVLGSVPVVDLPAVIREVCRLANKAVYIAEKIGPVEKAVFSSAAAMPRGWGRAEWEAAIKGAAVGEAEVWLATRERTAEGVQVTRGRIV